MILKKLDPRTKLIFMLSLSMISVFSGKISVLLCMALIAVAVLCLSPLEMLRGIRQSASLLGLIAMLFIVQCVFNRSGEPLLAAGEFVLVRTGAVETAAAVCLRLTVIMLAALVLRTGETRDYLLAMTQSRIPYELAFMVMVALRFIPLLREEAVDVLSAVQMRGTKLKKTGVVNKLRVYTSVMLPIAAGAIRRAEQIAAAMEARAFRSRPSRTSMRRLRFKAADAVFLTLYILALTAVPALL